MPNAAAMARQHKANRPSDYCPHCLWRLSSGPCPRHTTFSITAAGRDALEESILAEHDQSNQRVLDEVREGA